MKNASFKEKNSKTEFCFGLLLSNKKTFLNFYKNLNLTTGLLLINKDFLFK